MKTDRAWALTAALLGIHQAEEVALSIRRWSDRVGPTGWRLFDEHIRRNPLAGYNPWGRAAVVAGQGAALYGLYRLTRADAARTRAVTTISVSRFSIFLHLSAVAPTGYGGGSSVCFPRPVAVRASYRQG